MPNTEMDFWSHVDGVGSDGCWSWTMCCFPKGYGAFKFNGKQWRTHRLAWTLTHGQIPDGLQVNHHCDNPACVNPAHLYIGTQKDNRQDAVRRGRTATGPRNGMHTHPESRVTGERNHNAKITDAQASEAITRFTNGERNVALLAREYGVTRQSLWARIRRSQAPASPHTP